MQKYTDVDICLILIDTTAFSRDLVSSTFFLNTDPWIHMKQNEQLRRGILGPLYLLRLMKGLFRTVGSSQHGSASVLYRLLTVCNDEICLFVCLHNTT
jgi:hypothetical protein